MVLIICEDESRNSLNVCIFAGGPDGASPGLNKLSGPRKHLMSAISFLVEIDMDELPYPQLKKMLIPIKIQNSIQVPIHMVTRILL